MNGAACIGSGDSSATACRSAAQVRSDGTAPPRTHRRIPGRRHDSGPPHGPPGVWGEFPAGRFTPCGTPDVADEGAGPRRAWCLGLPQRPRRLGRHPDNGPLGRGGLLRRVHGLHPALVLGARRGPAGRRQHGLHHLLPARRRPRVPHLLRDGPWQRTGQRVPRPARHDALRPRRGVGGQARGRRSCWFWHSALDGNATWGPASRLVPQWTRPGATPAETLGRHGYHH